MTNSEKDNEFLKSLNDIYPQTEDELKLLVFKILSLPCSKALDRMQLLAICNVNNLYFYQKRALRAVEVQIKRVSKQFEKNQSPIFNLEILKLTAVYEALEICFTNYRKQKTSLETA